MPGPLSLRTMLHTNHMPLPLVPSAEVGLLLLHMCICRSTTSIGRRTCFAVSASWHAGFQSCRHVQNIRIALTDGAAHAVEQLLQPMEFVRPLLPSPRHAGSTDCSHAQNIRIALTDGAAHAVDSSEMAFKLACMYAFKSAYTRASPVILEPMMTVEVCTTFWLACSLAPRLLLV